MWKGDQDLGSLEGMTPTGHHWWYLYHPEWMTSEWAAAGALVSRSDWEVQATIFDYEKLLDRPIKKKRSEAARRVDVLENAKTT